MTGRLHWVAILSLVFGAVLGLDGGRALELGATDARIKHILAETRPVDPSFSTAGSEEKYSAAHCFSSSMQVYDWRSNACILKNLCFNTSSKEFLFFAKDQHQIPDNVSIGTFNYKWGTQYDNTVRFRPKIVVGHSIPPNHVVASEDELWVPYLPFCAANIGHLIWDDYLTIYFLSWAALPLLFDQAKKFKLRPLWYNPPFDPPWATCDWIRLHEGPGHRLKAGYSLRCTKNNERWLPLMLGEGNHIVPETSKVNWTSPPGDTDLICFPNAAYGVTPFANQASGHHGWRDYEGIAPAFGRGPMLFEFTRHMMNRAHGSDVPRKSLKDIVVFFSSKSSNRVSLDFTSHAKAIEAEIPTIEQAVAQLVGHDRLKVKVKHEVLYTMTALEQVELAASACVYVTAAGGGAFTAQFLPRGASIVLYHNSQDDSMHQGRVDWKFFNSASWMRSTFINLDMRYNVTLLRDVVVKEVMNCLAFMEALDV